MNSARRTWLLWGGTIAGLLLAAAVAVYPGYRVAHQAQGRMESLREMVQSLPGRITEVDRLSHELEEIRATIRTELRQVPADPDIASLFQALSLPVDGVAVRDRTFAAGAPVEALPAERSPTLVVPVTVEMEASFDSIFALLRAAETATQLVRVTSVKVTNPLSKEGEGTGFLSAAIGLDAVYEAAPRQETSR
jgi:Tfp pilus assembly protein PilO